MSINRCLKKLVWETAAPVKIIKTKRTGAEIFNNFTLENQRYPKNKTAAPTKYAAIPPLGHSGAKSKTADINITTAP